MSLLLRRRSLLSRVTDDGWDGKDCVAVGADKTLYYSSDYGESWVKCQAITASVLDACIARDSRVPEDKGSAIWFVDSTWGYFTRPESIVTGSGWLQRVRNGIYRFNDSICCSGDGTIAFGSQYNHVDKNIQISKLVRTDTDISASRQLYVGGQYSIGVKNTGLIACSVNGQYCVVGGFPSSNRMYQSSDTGETWELTTTTQSLFSGITNDLDCSVDGKYFIASADDGYIVSDNWLGSWDGGDTDLHDTHFGVSVAYRQVLSERVSRYRQKIDTLYVSSSLSGEHAVSGAPKLMHIRSNAKGNRLIGIDDFQALWFSKDWGESWTSATVPAESPGFVKISMVKYFN